MGRFWCVFKTTVMKTLCCSGFSREGLGGIEGFVRDDGGSRMVTMSEQCGDFFDFLIFFLEVQILPTLGLKPADYVAFSCSSVYCLPLSFPVLLQPPSPNTIFDSLTAPP